MSKNTTEQLVESLSALTVLEMSELKKLLEEKWGVEASAPMMAVGAPAAGGGEAAAASESTEFEVTLESAPADKKIGVIKVVREITGLGLKEAKELVEAAPKVLKESVSKAEAEKIQQQFKDAVPEAKITLKGL